MTIASASLGGVFNPAAFQPVLISMRTGIVDFAVHAGLTFAILALGVVVYVLLTPHKELRLVREGNTAAAVSLGSIIVGLALPLAIVMTTSLNWADIIVWGALTLLVQLLVFRVVDLLLPGLPKRIGEGDLAAATLLAAFKLSTAMILAAAANGAPLKYAGEPAPYEIRIEPLEGFDDPVEGTGDTAPSPN